MEVLFTEMSDACKAKFDELGKVFNPPIEQLKGYDVDARRWISEKQKEHGEQDFLHMGEELLKQEKAYLWVKVLKGEYDFYLYLSMFYYHFCLFKYNKNLLADGCRHFQDAFYYCGAWKGAREREEWDTHCHMEQLEQIGRAKRAGESRGEKYTPIKAEILRLLKSRAPVSGWSKKVTAIKAIEDELWEFIVKGTDEAKGQPVPMKKENLQRTILDWSRKDESIGRAFDEVMMIKKTKQ